MNKYATRKNIGKRFAVSMYRLKGCKIWTVVDSSENTPENIAHAKESLRRFIQNEKGGEYNFARNYEGFAGTAVWGGVNSKWGSLIEA